jgi:hypothetical protein
MSTSIEKKLLFTNTIQKRKFVNEFAKIILMLTEALPAAVKISWDRAGIWLMKIRQMTME